MTTNLHEHQRTINLKYFRIGLCGSWLIILLFFSCSTTSQLTVSTSQTVENIQPQWESFASGIDIFHAKTSSPKLEFWALRINLNSPNVSIFVSADENKVSDFVRSNNLIAGINATPFDNNKKNAGLVISNGVIHSPVNPNYDALVFFRDGRNKQAIIVNQGSILSTVNIDNAVGGFHQILVNGIPAARTEREGTVSAQRHPRSAAGVSANGGILYLLVIDGRRAGSAGATEKETALLLRALGANDGLNLDGGGSSALVLRFPDGSIKTVNKPGGFGRERTVAACIGIEAPAK